MSAAASSLAGVQRIHLAPAQPAFAGRLFDGRAYEWLAGTAFLAADPADPANAPVVHLSDAPRDRDGLVRYEADVAILRPVADGNGWMLYDVLNRGTKRAVHRINTATGSNLPATEAEAGTGWLMRGGWTLVWSGWQHDVPPGGGRMAARLPAVAGLEGWSREEWVLDLPAATRDDSVEAETPTHFTYRLTYAAAPRPEARLTVRQNEADPHTPVDPALWRFDGPGRIVVAQDARAPFDRGAIWEFTYRATDPVVTGLGLLGMRDVAAFLRHGTAADGNPLAGTVRHAAGFGLSQSGRVLRDFLRWGFNRDTAGRPVFDAVMPVIAGSRRAFVNLPFAQPGRFPRQHEDHLFPGDQFPFAYATQADVVGRRTDGVLPPGQQDTRVIHLDSESEMFSARTSLVVTDTTGQDAVLPDNVRVYVASGTAHGDYPLPPEVATAEGNTLTYGALARAALHALRRWVEDGTSPPPSRHPTRADGTLVDLPAAASAFPRLPQTAFPGRLNALALLDHGTVPPSPGAPYPVFVGITDADGNMRGGVPHPLTVAPLGTHTGWQLRKHGFAPGELMNVFGAFVPFAATRAEREAAGDPRPSLEERYGSAAGWRNALAVALPGLVAAGYLLPEDADRVLVLAAAGYPARLNVI